MKEGLAEIFTDGSCHTQYKIGTWAAIIFTGAKKKILSGTGKDTTHNRMELTAVIKAIEYVRTHYKNTTSIKVYTDSQYVTNLPLRRQKISEADFTTQRGAPLQNADLVKTFFETLSVLSIEFIKIKAHQKKTDVVNGNREADMLSRKLLRNAVEEFSE
jgi:ribonuclease HI